MAILTSTIHPSTRSGQAAHGRSFQEKGQIHTDSCTNLSVVYQHHMSIFTHIYIQHKMTSVLSQPTLLAHPGMRVAGRQVRPVSSPRPHERQHCSQYCHNVALPKKLSVLHTVPKILLTQLYCCTDFLGVGCVQRLPPQHQTMAHHSLRFVLNDTKQIEQLAYLQETYLLSSKNTPVWPPLIPNVNIHRGAATAVTVQERYVPKATNCLQLAEKQFIFRTVSFVCTADMCTNLAQRDACSSPPPKIGRAHV